MGQDKISRRNFLNHTVALGSTSLLAAGCNRQSQAAGSAKSGKRYKWRMSTFWGPNFKILQEGAELFATWVESMSEGRLQIKVSAKGRYRLAMVRLITGKEKSQPHSFLRRFHSG